MPIDRVTVSLATSRTQAAYLQQQVSQLMQQLNPQLAALLAQYLPADAPVVERLRVDIGTLPLSQFSWQFAPRLLAALEQVLQQREVNPTDAFVMPATQHRGAADRRVISNNPEEQDIQGDPRGDAPDAALPADATPPQWSALVRYLSNGYWPTFATVSPPVATGAVQPDAAASEQKPQPGMNTQGGSYSTPQQLLRQRLAAQPSMTPPGRNAQSATPRTPQQLLRQRLAGQPSMTSVGENARSATPRTPQQLLRQRLAGQPEMAPAEQAALIGALQLPSARQRLLRLMTASDWHQLCARLAPAARLSTPSPLALLLLLWQQSELPALHLFSAAELRPPQPQERRELERLLTADHPQQLLALQPWLEQQAQQRPTAALTAAGSGAAQPPEPAAGLAAATLCQGAAAASPTSATHRQAPAAEVTPAARTAGAASRGPGAALATATRLAPFARAGGAN